MKIAFHSNQLGLRGTEVALFDYALYSEEILGHESIIISDIGGDLSGLDKFQARFSTILYDDFSLQVPRFVDLHGIDVLYLQKAGFNDGKVVPNAKNVVHSVFQYNEPHGSVYAYISSWLAKKMGRAESFVPYMVDIVRHDHPLNYRESLNISSRSTVFGYYGGADSFNIDFVRRAVVDAVLIDRNIYFIFMNITPFANHPNILFFDGSTDIRKKIGFINTCDACIHARNGGESFGLTIAEFSSKNKPVITTDYATVERNDLAHLDMLGEKAITYSSYGSLLDILLNFRLTYDPLGDWNAYGPYSPKAVMRQFEAVFL